MSSSSRRFEILLPLRFKDMELDRYRRLHSAASAGSSSRDSVRPVAGGPSAGYHICMIRIRFSDPNSKRRALGYLAGRFSFKSWATGEMIVPAAALPFLAQEGIQFAVEGPASYEQLIPPLRDPSAAAI